MYHTLRTFSLLLKVNETHKNLLNASKITLQLKKKQDKVEEVEKKYTNG